jgi:uncharacterized protein YbaR (Trm112 family)
MAAKSLLCPVTKHKINLVFPERHHCADADEPIDGLDDDAFSGFFPIDEVSPVMLAAIYCEGEAERDKRISADDDVAYPDRLDSVGMFYELFDDLYSADGEAAEHLSLSDEGDEAFPVSHCSVSREACKPSPEQKDSRVYRNVTKKTLSRGKRHEYILDDGTVIRATDKVTKVTCHHSHGLRGRKPAKPSRETVRRMVAIDGASYFMNALCADTMN